MNSTPRRQKGVTLLIGLIMLVLLTLLAITSFNLGKNNLLTVGNMQFRNETVRAAEEAIETAISTPAGVNAVTTASIDVNANGTPDVAVTITPTLLQAHVKKNTALDLSDPNQLGCTLGQAQTFGVVGAATGNSLCAATLYDLKAVATEAATGATIDVHQGISVQVPVDAVCALVPC
jgi:hypothetical protein